MSIELPTQPFTITKAIDLFKNGQLKDYGDCKTYVNQYFFKTTQGDVIFYDIKPHVIVDSKTETEKKIMKGEWTFYDRKDVSCIWLNCIYDESNEKTEGIISKWFMKQPKVFYPTLDLFKPLMYCEDGINFINLSKTPIHREKKQYSSFSDDIKRRVELFLSFIKEVPCSENEDMYKYLIKWIANMCKGNKNDSLLYLKGPEGTGKSTLSDMLMEYVLGHDVSLITGSRPIKSDFNKSLMGKMLVVFEELETFSTNEWTAVSGKLKRYITSKRIDYESKGVDAFNGPNFNNYIINTNVEAIKDSDGRRICMLDVSTKRRNDRAYFRHIKDQCYNNEVGHALYCYLMEVDVKGFNAQEEMPMTENKHFAMSERLDEVYKFLKYEFLLKNRSVDKVRVSDLYQHFLDYQLSINSKRTYSNISFCKKLKEINIDFKKTGGHNYFTIPLDTLKTLSEKYHWVNELDETEEENETPNNNPELDGKTAREVQLEQEIKKLKEEIEQLKQKNKESLCEYQEIFEKSTDDDLEAELLALTSSEQKQNIEIIDDVSSLDDLRKMDEQLKKQKKNKK